ncbi:MAG: PRC-barrel domain containing protein, partial [Actinobacteria bacterium]
MGDIPSWIGTQVGDRVGRNVGTVCDVYYDEASSQPAWLLVNTRERLVLVPADGALSWSVRVIVPHDRDVIDAAPAPAAPAVLAGEPLLRLARHYGVRVDRCAGCT